MLSHTPTNDYKIKFCNFFATLLKIYMHRTAIFRTFRYYRANPWIKNDSQIVRNNMTRSRINIITILAVSGVRVTSFDIKIRNWLLKLKFSALNRSIIFITNNWYFITLKIIWYGWLHRLSLKILGNSIKSIPLLIKGILTKCLIWLILESMTGQRACWV